MDHEQRIKNLENAMQQMFDHYWRFQGRIHALEVLATLAVFDRASLDANPFEWVQNYVRVVETKQETKIAIDEFLEQLVRMASALKGAPPKPQG